jgi:protein subunit release factor A
LLLEENKSRENDREIKNLYGSEIHDLHGTIDSLYDELALHLLDNFPEEKCFVEIKPFAGGKEAYLFSCEFVDYLIKISSIFKWNSNPNISAEKVNFL